MKYLLFILLLISAIISAGCVGENKNTISIPAQPTFTTSYASSDPSVPASAAETYCLDVGQVTVVQPTPREAYGGEMVYYPLVAVTGTITSHCNYPVEGVAQLKAYDKNKNMIPGLFQNGVQDSQSILLKQGETKSYSMTFDMRRVPDNPRDPDPSISANFEVTAFVKRIVSGREASTW